MKKHLIVFILFAMIFLIPMDAKALLIELPRDNFGNLITFSELSEFPSPVFNPTEHRPLHYQTIIGVRFDYPLLDAGEGISTAGAFFTTTPSLDLGDFLEGAVIEGDAERRVSIRFGPRAVTKFGFDFAIASDISLFEAIKLEVFDAQDNNLGTLFMPATFTKNGTSHGGLFIEDTRGINRLKVDFLSRHFLFDNVTFDEQVPVDNSNGGSIDNNNGGIMDHAVPEPATILLFSSGIFVAFVKRRRRA